GDSRAWRSCPGYTSNRDGGFARLTARRRASSPHGNVLRSRRLDRVVCQPRSRGPAWIVNTYHRCCTELIERNGGFVANYMGDGVLAYFGYPQAHEHDAERAVRAGLNVVGAVPKL